MPGSATVCAADMGQLPQQSPAHGDGCAFDHGFVHLHRNRLRAVAGGGAGHGGLHDEEGGREQAVIALLRSIKEDPLREGLKGTPGRVNRAYDEIFAGYGKTASDVLTTSFASEAYDEMVILKDIEFYSMCEHHILPFYGRVAFAYIPDGKVVGVSKISRLIEIYSRRLQIQERMTMQIGKEFEGVMSPKGVAVVVEGVHLCMLMRGVKKENATMITSYMGGIFREKIEARNEFLALIKKEK